MTNTEIALAIACALFAGTNLGLWIVYLHVDAQRRATALSWNEEVIAHRETRDRHKDRYARMDAAAKTLHTRLAAAMDFSRVGTSRERVGEAECFEEADAALAATRWIWVTTSTSAVTLIGGAMAPSFYTAAES